MFFTDKRAEAMRIEGVCVTETLVGTIASVGALVRTLPVGNASIAEFLLPTSSTETLAGLESNMQFSL